jgi:DNA-binding transcriptional ArsR family regulator
MGWIEDVLKEVPLSAVLKERIALAGQKYEAAIQQVDELRQKVAALERENAELRAQIPRPHEPSLGEDTTRVLVHLFKAKEIDDRDVGNMARALNMDRGVLQYHLDRLDEAGLAKLTGGNYVDGHVYWGLKPEGRQYVVERKLI